MRKHIKTLIIVILITGAALWGSQQLRFFEKLPAVFSQTAFAAHVSPDEGIGRGQGGFRGGRGRGNLDPSQPQTFPFTGSGSLQRSGNSFGGRGQGGHARTASLAGWVNVSAYLSIFAFIVMLTYYGELGIRKLAKRQEACVSS
jgi:hypothetical protein